MASHTTCAEIYRHFRGKPDDVIKAICDTDGLVGMCCIPRFLGGKGDITALLEESFAEEETSDEKLALAMKENLEMVE